MAYHVVVVIIVVDVVGVVGCRSRLRLFIMTTGREGWAGRKKKTLLDLVSLPTKKKQAMEKNVERKIFLLQNCMDNFNSALQNN